ncbi:MAG: CehA/McbA family metallohydrolase [Clostridiales bacterium]|nr:CehA/McbA family metallohydrolase [Clostridiales bacterium]
MDKEKIVFQRFVEKSEEKTYFPVEFQVPEHVEKLEIAYSYQRFSQQENEQGDTVCSEINIIDLAVCAAGGKYIGSSGSDRNRIELSAYGSSQGFAPCEIDPGTWQIILGAYKVQEEGCCVEYTVTFHKKKLRLYKGDTHMHTTGSDGHCSLQEIGWIAKKQGLDYVFVTDHNNYAHNEQIPLFENLTMLPGAEWTHYKGHAGMLGVKKPYDNAFCVNTEEEMKEKFDEGKRRGALTVLNHPFCPNCGWKWGMETVAYDLIEVWNGGTSSAINRKCLDWWDNQLKEGKRIPVIGGSDFHRVEYGSLVGSPCTCIFSWSRTGKDLMEAMKAGHSFIVYGANGPMVEAEAGGYLMGDVIPTATDVKMRFWNLREGDVIALISDQGEETVTVKPQVKELRLSRKVENVRYLRAEVRRAAAMTGEMPALLTNPFYLENPISL